MSQECLQVNTWLKNWFYDESEVDSLVSGKSVTVEKKGTADTGFLASYVVKQGGSQVGATINIPKDFLVKSGSVKTCSTANVPVTGYVVGDKYLDLIINTKDGSGSDEHLYILSSDLVDVPIDWSDVENKPSSFTPSAHSHGYLSDTGEVTNTNMSRTITVPVGVDSYNKLVKANKMENTAIVQPTALSNLGTTGGATQTVVNGAIDTKIGDIETLIGNAITTINGTGGS